MIKYSNYNNKYLNINSKYKDYRAKIINYNNNYKTWKKWYNFMYKSMQMVCKFKYNKYKNKLCKIKINTIRFIVINKIK